MGIEYIELIFCQHLWEQRGHDSFQGHDSLPRLNHPQCRLLLRTFRALTLSTHDLQRREGGHRSIRLTPPTQLIMIFEDFQASRVTMHSRAIKPHLELLVFPSRFPSARPSLPLIQNRGPFRSKTTLANNDFSDTCLLFH